MPEPKNPANPAGWLLQFPLLSGTALVAVAMGILLAFGQGTAAQVGTSAYVLLLAAYRAVSMIRDLAHGRWGIDLLAITAIASTVAVGEFVAAIIVALMLTGGEALEEFAHRRASRELSALLERAPQVAHMERADGEVEDIPAASVVPGTILVVRPSEVLPVDGRLLSPTAVFDESTLTGESLPVEHRQGDQLLSGSVNGESAVRVSASATAAESQYSQIVALVQEAAASRAPIVRLADRYAAPFTLLAFLLAGAAWLGSQDPGRFAEVLVVATPCPLLIAAPVAFLSGTSRAAHAGIIIKDSGTLERLSRVRTAVFDKTGTLTRGRPALHGIRLSPAAAGRLSQDRLLQLAASAEQYSSHVLASSVLAAARARGLALLKATGAHEHATQGVTALCGGHTVTVGKADFVRSSTTGFVPAALEGGELGVYVGVDGGFAGTLVMEDPLRADAPATLAALKQLGVSETMLLTGDAYSTARKIAADAGITNVLAECLPGGKVTAVAELPDRAVMMVGDGVNDAPVLAAADVGVAMGARGATAASESADVVIMLDDLSRAALAVEIGRRTMNVARASIWTGILLSIGLMSAAGFGYIPAVGGALLQELVDLATILNALRALRPGPKR